MAHKHSTKPYVRPVYPSNAVRGGFFKAGNTHAATANLDEDANRRRMAGLFKTWDRNAHEAALRKKHGKGYMKIKAKRVRRPRIQLRTTIAKEAREIQELARTHASQAMKRMAEIINDPSSPDNIAVAAAEVIFNRAYGKPNQTNTNLNVDANGKSAEVSGPELNKRIEEALERVKAITERAAKAPAGKKQPAHLRKLDRNPHGPNEPVN